MCAIKGAEERGGWEAVTVGILSTKILMKYEWQAILGKGLRRDKGGEKSEIEMSPLYYWFGRLEWKGNCRWYLLKKSSILHVDVSISCIVFAQEAVFHKWIGWISLLSLDYIKVPLFFFSIEIFFPVVSELLEGLVVQELQISQHASVHTLFC